MGFHILKYLLNTFNSIWRVDIGRFCFVFFFLIPGCFSEQRWYSTWFYYWLIWKFISWSPSTDLYRFYFPFVHFLILNIFWCSFLSVWQSSSILAVLLGHLFIWFGDRGKCWILQDSVYFLLSRAPNLSPSFLFSFII